MWNDNLYPDAIRPVSHELSFDAKNRIIREQKTEIDGLRRVIAKLREHNELGCASAHVLIECGVIPGIDSTCRCEECRLVARSMSEAGYLERVKDRWWEAD